MRRKDPTPTTAASVAPAAPAAPRTSTSIVRSLFSLHTPPNEVTKMHNAESFSQLPFIGGEEEGQDHWHDKWEAHRR
jgi:hypothetical protein